MVSSPAFGESVIIEFTVMALAGDVHRSPHRFGRAIKDYSQPPAIRIGDGPGAGKSACPRMRDLPGSGSKASSSSARCTMPCVARFEVLSEVCRPNSASRFR